MSSNETRVLIVKDHQVVAEGLAALINDQDDMTVVGHTGSVTESINRAVELKPDLVLIDFRLTDGTGADAATGIRQVRPETRLIFLTREDSDAARFAAIEAGASAFIHKSRAAQEVVDEIKRQFDLADTKLRPLPIGWPLPEGSRDWWFWAQKTLGLFVTGLALSLGAPFWFDALSKFMNVRAAGVKPERQT